MLTSLAGGCGGAGASADELAAKVQELEADLDEISTTSRIEEPVGSAVESDDLNPELIRMRFKAALDTLIADLEQLMEGDTFVQAFDVDACRVQADLLDGWVRDVGWDDTAKESLEPLRKTVCSDLHWEFRLERSTTFDIESTDSIIAPFTATARLPVRMTSMQRNRSGDRLGGPDGFSPPVVLHWAYRDGHWDLEAIETELGDELQGVVAAMIEDGLPPSRFSTVDLASESITLLDELCAEAEQSESGERFIAHRFSSAGETLSGAELDKWFNANHKAIQLLIDSAYCPTPRAREVIREAVPFTTEAQG